MARSSHGSKSYQRELDQRLTGQTKEARDRQKLAALRGHVEFATKLGRDVPDKQKRQLAKLSAVYG